MARDEPDPVWHLLDDLGEEGRHDPELDPRVRTVLLSVHHLTAPLDEVTRRQHLDEIQQLAGRTRRGRRLGRLGRASAVAVVLTLGLAATGLLPATLQQTVADAATLVGITLPAPGSSPGQEPSPGAPPQISEIGTFTDEPEDDAGDVTGGERGEGGAEGDEAEGPDDEPGASGLPTRPQVPGEWSKALVRAA